MQSYLSRFALSRKVSTWTNSKLIIAVVAKLTFDLMLEQPSCKVTGLSSSSSGSFATRARSGLTASVVRPESKSIYVSSSVATVQLKTALETKTRHVTLSNLATLMSGENQSIQAWFNRNHDLRST